MTSVLWVSLIFLFGIGFNITLETKKDKKHFVGICAAVSVLTAYLYGRHVAFDDLSSLGPFVLSLLFSVQLLWGFFHTDLVQGWMPPVLSLCCLVCCCEALVSEHLLVIIVAMMLPIFILGKKEHAYYHAIITLPALLLGFFLLGELGTDMLSSLYVDLHRVPFLRKMLGTSLFAMLFYMGLWPAYAMWPKTWFTVTTFFSALCAFLVMQRVMLIFEVPSWIPLYLGYFFLVTGVIRLYAQKKIRPFEHGFLLHVAFFCYALPTNVLWLYAGVITCLYAVSCCLLLTSRKQLPYLAYQRKNPYLLGFFSLSMIPASLSFAMMMYVLFKLLMLHDMAGIVLLFAVYVFLSTAWTSALTPSVLKFLTKPSH